MIYLYFILLIICFLILIKSGSVLVKTLINIAHYLNWSEYLVSFIFMACATSVPELFIGLSSAATGHTTLSLGNILGANIINLTLALGLISVFTRGINLNNDAPKKDSWLIFILVLVPLVQALDGQISRLEGLILLLLFFWYITRLAVRSKNYHQNTEPAKLNLRKFKHFFLDIFWFVVALCFLLASSSGVVWNAIQITDALNISLVFVGLIIISLGTTLPEIIFGWRSVLIRHENMALGNAIGSLAFNSLFILGLVSVIKPIQIPDITFIKTTGLLLALILLIFNFFIRTKNKLSYAEGLVLISLYFIFVIIEFFNYH